MTDEQVVTPHRRGVVTRAAIPATPRQAATGHAPRGPWLSVSQ
jgi:hypothetical protein